MTRFDPPGFLDDLSDAQKDQWSQMVSGWLDRRAPEIPPQNDGPRAQFFNPLTNPPARRRAGGGDLLERVSAPGEGELAERHAALAPGRRQTATCRTNTANGASPAIRRHGKIIRVDFHLRGPGVLGVLAALNPDKVVELYREFVSPAVTQRISSSTADTTATTASTTAPATGRCI